MSTLAFLALASLLLSIWLTPVFRCLYLSLKWLDHPRRRNGHSHPTPGAGGILIVLAYLGAFGIAFRLHIPGTNFASGSAVVVRLLPAVLIILFIGLLDDIFGLRPWQKLA